MKVSSRSKNGQTDGKVQRISVSLPDSVFRELDQLVEERGFESRSKAIADMVTCFALEHQEDKGDSIMAGTTTLAYYQPKSFSLLLLVYVQPTLIEEISCSIHSSSQHKHPH